MSATAVMCNCGCGEMAPVAPRTDSRKGWVKGQPLKWIQGHATRRRAAGPNWVGQDCGWETPCWTWRRAVSPGGYGRLNAGGRLVQAHRFYYEKFKGPIPDGLQLDHLCRNRRCVNPEHLEPVTNAENQRRGLKGVLREPRTHCNNGHELTPENTRITAKGHVRCRACHRINAAASRQRKALC